MRRFLLTVMILAILPAISLADGFPLPVPQPWMPPHPRIDIKYHHVDTEINDPIAITKVDQVFANPFDREIEADYIFPIPDNAAISNFTAWLGGKQMQAELLDAVQARRIYEDIVARRKDPALLEYAGRGMYRMRIYPIPPHGEVRIKIQYEQTLQSDNGTVEYLYPLNTEKYSRSNLEDCRVNIKINSFENIGSVYCPTHNIATERINDKSMTAYYSERDIRPDKDMIIYFTRQNKDFGFHLISYKRTTSEDGFFLGILSPPLQSRLQKSNKNLIFILDSSGSMAGEKIRQVIEALNFGLQNLNPGDRFDIIDYDDNIKEFKSGVVEANDTNIKDAKNFIDNISAGGGTDIYDVLRFACDLIPDNSNPTYLIFLTDGVPTVGNTNIDDIIKNTTSLNHNRARLFVFGAGYDVNAHLLDRLAQDNKGTSEYVQPNENIEVKVSRLAAKINSPALTDLSLSFGSMKTDLIYPAPLPDLFFGSEIIITGRFHQLGNSQAIISGKINGKEVTYEFPVSFQRGNSDDELVSMLWANRRIGYLLQQIRLHGKSDELLNEVVFLSKRYGIITEFTSFLIAGDEYIAANGSRNSPAPFLMDNPAAMRSLADATDRLSSEQSGKSAVMQSKALEAQKFAVTMPSPTISEGEGKSNSNKIAQIGSQAFFQAGENWIQGDLVGDKFDIEIERYSRAYYQILDKDPKLGKYLALGETVRLKIGSQVVQVSGSGKTLLTDSEIRTLFPN